MKIKSLIFYGFTIILLSFLFVSDVRAADINWAAQSGASTSCVDITSNYPPATSQGECNYIRDNNNSTMFYVSDTENCAGPCQIVMIVSYKAIVNFAQTAPFINKIEIVWKGGGAPINQGGNSIIDLYYNNAWNQVATFSTLSTSVITSSLSGSWSNVSAIRVRASATGSAQFFTPAFAGAGYGTYELRAYGPEPPPANIDCGLRIKESTGIIGIACEPAGTLTSPLRIRKGATTYGIILVDPADPNASKTRVKTIAGIKALRKF